MRENEESGTTILDESEEGLDCQKEFEEGVPESTSQNASEEAIEVISDENNLPSDAVSEINVIEAQNPSQKTKQLMIRIAAAVVLCLIAVFGIQSYNRAQEEKAYKLAFNQYVVDVSAVHQSLAEAGVDAEDLCSMTKDIWYNAIYSKPDSFTDTYTRPAGVFVDDFNVALRNFYSSPAIELTVDVLEVKNTILVEDIKNLQNPPAGLENCYQTVTELYDAYVYLANLAASPSGSYNDYTANTSAAVSDFIKYSKRLEAQTPNLLSVK